jgi:hypothetical protein
MNLPAILKPHKDRQETANQSQASLFYLVKHGECARIVECMCRNITDANLWYLESTSFDIVVSKSFFNAFCASQGKSPE